MSLVAIVVISIITNYTGKLIIECLYEKPFSDQVERGVRLRNSYASIGKFTAKMFKLCKIDLNSVVKYQFLTFGEYPFPI